MGIACWIIEPRAGKRLPKYGCGIDAADGWWKFFPEQKDFAVADVWDAGNPGYLGVCFGSVITANSRLASAQSCELGRTSCGMSSVTWLP